MIKKLKEILKYHYQIGLLVWLSEVVEQLKQFNGKILCLFHIHSWKLICWDFKKSNRYDNCTRCKRTQKVYDPIVAKFVRDLRVMAWQERRRVITEKYKNVKSYVLSISYGNEICRMLEFKSSDGEYASKVKSFLKTCADADITEDRVHIHCLDTKNEEIPDMFLL